MAPWCLSGLNLRQSTVASDRQRGRKTSGEFHRQTRKWLWLEWIVCAYILITAIFLLLQQEYVPQVWRLLGFRLLVLLILILLPPRGSAWEFPSGRERLPARKLREIAIFVRYCYPLLLILFFFEEVEYTVTALFPRQGYWFEPSLQKAEWILFGGYPVRHMADWNHPFLNEFMHAFYFAYFPILIGAQIFLWRRLRKLQVDRSNGGPETGSVKDVILQPALTGMTLAYLFTFLLFPLLPARGPWEHPSVVADLAPLEGYFFTGVIQLIIRHGAVSGGCFPSSHVSGTWGMIAAIGSRYSRLRTVCCSAAILMSFACVYTRYHWALDVIAGLPIGLLAAWIARKWIGSSNIRDSKDPAS